MAKIKLEADPTFKAQVAIPVPGSESPALVEFTFKHRTRTEVLAWLDAAKDADDVQSVMDCVAAWEMDDALTAENVKRLCENYMGAGNAIVATYLNELRGARTKN